MKIIVTGDTHIAGEPVQLPLNLINACKSADLIIHTGDWKSMEVYHLLCQYAEVKGVYGNVDSYDITSKFPEKQLIEVNGFQIGIVHGHGEKKTTEQRALQAFTEESPDAIIFGHSHIPLIRYFKNTLLMNPGSPTSKRALPYFSYGILEIDKNIHAEIEFFSKEVK
ncbi:YfcE family phosphodiesterase [Virgibacillus halodenitrificans]|uniref:Phosphoesterase n=1 Tax=Virgibacillus halodenitrificans TaxID=1482 RepID=A0AAC9NKE8_VIRHA|nr:metallophosphoesterase family protein [Virgibacillus halodenitrificans]APC47948.1 YfcE family phosphodiesterase [Virgibacillus halodenitrificans]MBD1224535.1 metallophosphoesterase [Virgibacillus halodenitrificans]CDQ37644.1 phosphodiesterase [Virgibacillus halodenitrificans]